jgi:hypothetical protein
MARHKDKRRQIGRVKDPNGKALAKRAQGAKLRKDKVVTGRKNGKTIRFTVREQKHPLVEDDLEQGTFVGVMETEHEGDETGLPPGKYNLHVALVNGELVGYAEADGVIIKKAARVTHGWREAAPGEDPPLPEFREEGFAWLICFAAVIALAVVFGSTQPMPQIQQTSQGLVPGMPGTPGTPTPAGLATVALYW